tara:strand:+ start:19026 stop:19670 length:645 start_codon:yes stop_codon:yes gene_type:complete
MARTAERQRGKQTREALLEAAIAVIARVGIEAVSHRAVADQAQMSPALTTYYFSGKPDLVLQAFEHYIAKGLPVIDGLWEQAFAILDAREDSLTTAATVRQLAVLAANFLCVPERRHREEVAFELAFFHQPRLEPALAVRVRAYRERMRQPALDFCRRCGSAAPEVDADLLMGLIARLEFEQLSQTIDVSVDRAAAQLERLVSLIMGLRANGPA